MGSENGVLANDNDPDGDQLFAIIETNPVNGQINLNADGSFYYSPNEDFVGEDSFSYSATDRDLTSSIVTVTIDVHEAPVAQEDTADTTANVPVIIDVLANDSDDLTAQLTVSRISNPNFGEVSLEPDGTIEYTPDQGFIGTDSFTYTVSDGGHEVTAGVSVNVDGNPTRRADTIQGTDEAETIQSLHGDDFIYAGGGDDVINSGGGDDTVFGGAGRDVFIPGAALTGW